LKNIKNKKIINFLKILLKHKTNKLRLHLFSASFCVCGETNVARCLVTNQIVFYAARSTKKLSLKRSFYAEVFICFFN